MNSKSLSISNDDSVDRSASNYSSTQPYSREYEVSKTSGSLRSVTHSIVRNQKANEAFDERRFLPKQTLLARPEPINVQIKLQQNIEKLQKKAQKRI